MMCYCCEVTSYLELFALERRKNDMQAQYVVV